MKAASGYEALTLDFSQNCLSRNPQRAVLHEPSHRVADTPLLNCPVLRNLVVAILLEPFVTQLNVPHRGVSSQGEHLVLCPFIGGTGDTCARELSSKEVREGFERRLRHDSLQLTSERAVGLWISARLPPRRNCHMGPRCAGYSRH
jgi:hypothetical protein